MGIRESKKRPLTPVEIKIAALIRSKLSEFKGRRTHIEIAGDIGVHPSMLFQWSSGKLPVAAARAKALAGALGLQPDEISLEWRERVALPAMQTTTLIHLEKASSDHTGGWPFKINRKRFDALKKEQRAELKTLFEGQLLRFELENAARIEPLKKKSGAG